MIRIVPDARRAWKWISVHALLLITSLPELWNWLPADLKVAIPHDKLIYVTSVIALAGLLGRFIHQEKPQ